MKRRTLFLLWALLLVLSVAKYVGLACFAHPVADDFCYAAKSAGQSLWGWSLSEWMYWNGRYASNLLMIHGPLTWFPDMLTGYRLVPVALLACTFLSAWFLLRKATGSVLSTAQELCGTLIFLLLYLNLMPDLGEGFYWYTGAVTYQLGSILLLLHAGLLFPGPAGRGAPRLALNLALAVAITGMDEVHMLLMVAFHMVRTAWLIATRRKAGTAPLFLLAVLAGALLMGLAPGNAVRGGMFADTHLFWRSLGMGALQSVRFIGGWLLSPALLAAGLLYMPLHPWLRQAVPAYGRLLRTPGPLAAALPFLLVLATTFPAYWATGLLGQHRTVNVACLLFIPVAFLNLGIALERGPLQKLAGLKPSARRSAYAMALLVAALNLSGNGLAVHADLWSGRLAEYDRTMMQREEQLRAAARDPSVRVIFIRLPHPPRTLATYEVLGPLRDWMMHCEARFLGAGEDQVVMEEGTRP